MILSKEFYIRASLFKRLWLHRQISNLSKSAKLFSPGDWKNFRPSVRTHKMPVFTGSKKDLLLHKDIKNLEKVCPTNAIKVTESKILISEKNCIGCLECVKAAPEGLLSVSQGRFLSDHDTN